MAQYKNTSPYFNTQNEQYFLDLMVNRPIPKLADDTLVTLTEVYHMRPDLLAHDLYGKSELWWVFAQRNPNTLQNPLGDFVRGVQIYLPKLETLQDALGF